MLSMMVRNQTVTIRTATALEEATRASEAHNDVSLRLHESSAWIENLGIH